MTQEKATAELTFDEAVKAAKEWQENADMAIPAEIVTGLVDGAEALLSEVAQLREALAQAALPYEALLMDTKSRKWIAPELWSAIEVAVTNARAALAGKER